MSGTRVRLGAGGRVVIPAGYRQALAIAEGDELVVTLEEGSLRISLPEAAVRRAQALVARHVPPDRRLGEELIAERLREAARE